MANIRYIVDSMGQRDWEPLDMAKVKEGAIICTDELVNGEQVRTFYRREASPHVTELGRIRVRSNGVLLQSFPDIQRARPVWHAVVFKVTHLPEALREQKAS